MCRFAPEISADKEENRRNPDGFQDFLTQSSGNLWREAVCGDLISGSLMKTAVYLFDFENIGNLSKIGNADRMKLLFDGQNFRIE